MKSAISDYELEQLFNTMLLLGKLVSQQTQQSPEAASATMLQFAALKYIKESPEETISLLGEQLALSKSSATQLVERLESSGYVKKNNDRNDKRIVRLSLTVNGEEQLKLLRAQVLENMKKVVLKIPAKDIKELTRIYMNLAEALKQ